MGHLPQTRKWIESTRKLRYIITLYILLRYVYIIMLRDRIIILEILSHFFSVFVWQTLWIWSYMKSLVPTNLDTISSTMTSPNGMPSSPLPRLRAVSKTKENAYSQFWALHIWYDKFYSHCHFGRQCIDIVWRSYMLMGLSVALIGDTLTC